MRHRKIIIILLTITLLTGFSTGCFQKSQKAATPTPQNVFREYVGQWEGNAGNIKLSFNVEADGTGQYTFEQSGYQESYSFVLKAGTDTFSVQIPENNDLNIAKIEGTYSYSGGILTLDVRTTFVGGRVFEYTVPCQRM